MAKYYFSSKFLLWSAIVAFALTLCGVGSFFYLFHTTQAQTASRFHETFDGNPTFPKPLGGVSAPPNWDFQINESEWDHWEILNTKAINAQHQSDCGDPFHDGSGFHTFDGSYENAVYQCKNHMMTFLGLGSYATIYFTPDHLVDFSDGEAIVSFDISTLFRQSRDWVDVWISPWEDHMASPLEAGADNFQGPPKNSVQVKMGGGMERGGFKVRITRDYIDELPVRLSKETVASALVDCTSPNDPSTTCGPSAKNRQTVQVVLSRDHIKVWMPDHNIVWYDHAISPGLTWDTGVVTFGHHRYNAGEVKGCEVPVEGMSCSNTWHWDNIIIDPAVPFTMIKADKRRTHWRFDWGTDQAIQDLTINLDAPAPKNAYLRFSAVGTVEVSYNGGSFELARRRLGAHQAGFGRYSHRPGNPSSYFTPIPAGTTQVDFRFTADGGHKGPFQATDFSIWSREVNSLLSPPAPQPILDKVDAIPPIFDTPTITTTNAIIEWTTDEPSDSQIEFCLTPVPCGFNTPLVQELTTTHSIGLFLLEPGITYYYWLKSRDEAGNLAVSEMKVFTTQVVQH